MLLRILVQLGVLAVIAPLAFGSGSPKSGVVGPSYEELSIAFGSDKTRGREKYDRTRKGRDFFHV